MRIEPLRPPILQVTLSTWELATLIAAARWALEGGTGELAPEALDQLQQVVAGYEAATRGTPE
ncbi:MAG TPA: hypothetical protein VE173_01945 [Longimicrobiales bacterium]|nr:hypothetical protein [Longimicrobiales bacterium]